MGEGSTCSPVYLGASRVCTTRCDLSWIILKPLYSLLSGMLGRDDFIFS